MPDASTDKPRQGARPGAKQGKQGRDGRRRRREQARTDVLRAALELAESAPFRDVTVDEIARATGISRSAFYTHFADKHELLMAALGEVAEELQRESDRWWGSSGTPAERVRKAVEGIVSVYAEQAGLMRVATEVSTYDDEVRALWLSVIELFIEATADHIRAEQRAGLIPDLLEARPTAEGLVWMVERCCCIYIAGGRRAPEELVAEIAPVWAAALYPGVVPAELLRPPESGGPAPPG
ncbi:hypothetical protein BH20ACT15_BH20ACT15_01760 [soil metagenome]